MRSLAFSCGPMALHDLTLLPDDPHIPAMKRSVRLLLLALFLAFSAFSAKALTLETLPAPESGRNLTDPDENLRLAPLSAPSDPRSGLRNPRSGFNFGFSGSSPSGNPRFIPGYTVPGQYGPAIDPQTKDPYRR
jgi:hypothetical protein